MDVIQNRTLKRFTVKKGIRGSAGCFIFHKGNHFMDKLTEKHITNIWPKTKRNLI